MGQGPDPNPMDTSDGFWKINTMVSLAAIFTPAVIMALILGYSGILFNFMQNLDYIKLKVFSSKQKERKELLTWLKENILRTSRRRCKVTEVEVWRDGSLLCSIINTVIPEACPNPSAHTNTPPQHGQALAFKYLDVIPVFSDEELKNNSLTLQQEQKLYHYLCSVYHAIKQLNAAVPAMKFSTEYVARGMGLVVARQHSKSVFYIYPVPNSKNFQYPADVEVTIKGPYNTKGHITIPSILHYYQKWQRPTDYTRALYLSSKLNNISPTTQGTSFLRKLSLKHTPAAPNNDSYIPIRVSISQSRAKVSYTPRSSGVYEVCLATRNGHVIGSPFTVPVEPATTGVPSNDSDSDQEEDAEENFIEKKKKVISRIVDFIDEKMMLLPDGTLVKIENDVSKENQSLLNKENILNNNSQISTTINKTATLDTEFFLEHRSSENTKNNDMNILQSITEHHFDVLNRNTNAIYLNRRESSSLHDNYEEILDYANEIQTAALCKSENGSTFKNKQNNVKYQKHKSIYSFREDVFNKSPLAPIVSSTETSFLIDNKTEYRANEASPWEIDPVKQELSVCSSDENNITATDRLTNTIKDELNSHNLDNKINFIHNDSSEKKVDTNKIVYSNVDDTDLFNIYKEENTVSTGELLGDTHVFRQDNKSSRSSEDWIKITEYVEENNNENKETNKKVTETIRNRTPTAGNEEINKTVDGKTSHSSFVLLNNQNDDYHLIENNQQLLEYTYSNDKYRSSFTPDSENSEDSIGSNVDYKSIQHTSHEYLTSLTPSSDCSEEHDIDIIETSVNMRDNQQESHSTSFIFSFKRNEEYDGNATKKKNTSVKNIQNTSNEDLVSLLNFNKTSEKSESHILDTSETERNHIYGQQKCNRREEYNFFHESTLFENDTNNSLIFINSNNRVNSVNLREPPTANESNQNETLISTANTFISTWEGAVEDIETEKFDSINVQCGLAHTPEFHDTVSFQIYEHQSADVNIFKDIDCTELSNVDFIVDDLCNAVTLKQDNIQMELDDVFDSNEFILVKQHTSDSFVLLNDNNCATYVSRSGSKQGNDMISHVYQENKGTKAFQNDNSSLESDLSIHSDVKNKIEVGQVKKLTSDKEKTKPFSVLSNDDQNFIREIDVISPNSFTHLSQFNINQDTHYASNEYVDKSHFQGNAYLESENSGVQFPVAKEPDLLRRNSTSSNTNKENLSFRFTTYPNRSSLDSIIGTPVKDIIEMFSSTDKMSTPCLSPSPTHSRCRSEGNADNIKFHCTIKEECKANKDENNPDLVKCHISSSLAINSKNVNDEKDTDNNINDLTGDDLKNAIKFNLERELSCKFSQITSSVHSNKRPEKFATNIDKHKQDVKSSYDSFSCLNTKENNTKIFGIVDKQKQFWQEKLEEIAKPNYKTYKEVKRNVHLNKSSSISKTNEFKNGIKLCTEPKVEYLKPFNGIVKSKKNFFESQYFSNENKNGIQKCHSEGNIYMRKCSKRIEFESISQSITKEDEIIKFPSVEERKAQLKRAYSMNTTSKPSVESDVSSETLTTIYTENINTENSPSYNETDSTVDKCFEDQKHFPSFKKTSVMRKARFRKAKLFFQSLEGSQSKTNMTGIEKHSPILLMHRSTSAPCLNTKLSLMRDDSSDYFVMKGKKISERFQVNDLFRDILGDKDKRFLGIPNRKAVVASLASFDSDSSRAEFDSDDNEPDLKHFAERPKKRRRRRHVVQGFHEDYPHPPTTDRWRYRPRSSITHTSLIPRSILLATSLDRIYF